MKRLLPLCLLPLLAACEAPPETEAATTRPGGVFTSIFRGPEAEPEPVVPEPLPPEVIASLPAGVPPSVVQRGVDGCYLLSIEVTTPPTGYPLRDSAGNPICEEGAVATASLPPATGLAPLPGSFEALGAPAPLGQGSITPPAPLAPLNPG